MTRTALRPILDVVLTVVLALVLLGGWQTLLSGSASDGFAEGFRVLVNFMDVGLAIWVVLLVVFTIRTGSRGGISGGRTYLVLLVGVVLNLLVVTVVGFAQGGWAPLLVLFAIEAGIACLLAAAVVVPLVHRVLAPVSRN